jgi:hypothetical protein
MTPPSQACSRVHLAALSQVAAFSEVTPVGDLG